MELNPPGVAFLGVQITKRLLADLAGLGEADFVLPICESLAAAVAEKVGGARLAHEPVSGLFALGAGRLVARVGVRAQVAVPPCQPAPAPGVANWGGLLLLLFLRVLWLFEVVGLEREDVHLGLLLFDFL